MHEPKVLFATDFVGDLKGGLQLATRLAAERAATLVLLHVVPLEPNEGEAMLYSAVDLAQSASESRLSELAPTDPGVPFLRVIQVGDPQARIADYVQRERVDLLVMEARARSSLKRALRRNLVDRLIATAGCPVVTYRPESVRLDPPANERRPLAAHVPAVDALTALLNARVDALTSWMRSRREAVLTIACNRSVRDGVASLHRATRHELGGCFVTRIKELLELELREHQRALAAMGVELVTAGTTLLQIGMRARRDAPYRRFIQRLEQRGAAVSVPLERADVPAGASCVILAGARVSLPGDETALLVFSFDARRDFLRILAQPGPGPSVETYAFDEQGVMLSNSRFPDQLRQVGLLPPDLGVQTARRLRLCDPGGNLLAGEVSVRPTERLTRMAAAATAGRDGCDWVGYRDYRGVEVVGAWRWIADYDFGVAAEMDRASVSPAA